MAFEFSMWYQEYDFGKVGGMALYAVTFIMLLISLAIVLAEPRALPKYRIKTLRIHPIKSCRGIEVDRAKLLRTGLRLDRRWMFVNSQGRFVTIRENSRMTLIKTAIIVRKEEEMLEVTVEGTDIKFSIATFPTNEWLAKNATKETVTIWGTDTDANVYPISLTQPISKFLGQEVRLALKGSDQPRILTSNGAPRHLGREQHMLFPDLAPLLVANTSSLDELNQRLGAKDENTIPIERFRPNVVLEAVDSTAPWIEDQWKTLRFGDRHGTDDSDEDEQSPLVVDVTSRCARCQVPNVDAKTGKKHAKEPWTTLMSYRRVDEGLKFKPCFGMLCAPRDEGDIWVGMEVFVTQITKKHKLLKD
jgi:uncharacterized protein YcbX